MDQTLIEDLHDSLSQRRRPEDVAETILSRSPPGAFSPRERAVLETAARHSLARFAESASSMSNAFFTAVAPRRQVETAEGLFRSAPRLSAEECGDPAVLNEFVGALSREIEKTVGASSFKHDRLNRAARADRGQEISRRRYNKLFRFLRRFERKIATFERQLNNVEDQMVAKSGGAGRIAVVDLKASPEAACFAAYYVARRNRRSAFTNQGQDPALDEIAQMLLERVRRAPREEGWRAVALVMPTREVVSHLSETGRLELLSDWLEALLRLAVRMGEIWDASRFDRATMIVSRGDDSSAWNALAGAWNAARQGWIATVEAMDMEDVLDLVCLGKAMRLMAGDVAAWHGGLHPDTAVWALLPPPWEVFLGAASCTRSDVEIACAHQGLDPVASGWISGRRQSQTVPFRPTPELVHGVTVSHPALAVILRKANWFSGKPTSPLPEGIQVAVRRDSQGWALRSILISRPEWLNRILEGGRSERS